ncbi:MAG: hypothetical protein F4X75_01080 [Gemmatimonadetes bacterium]|nr:hypothetical protein [Gemmatimonadota bacterium]
MPTIRVSAETMQRLKRWADPLEDTAESAISKALDAAEKMREEEDRVHAAERVAKDLSDIGLESAEKSLFKSSESFVDHLLAIPNVGNDADFERDRSGPHPFNEAQDRAQPTTE